MNVHPLPSLVVASALVLLAACTDMLAPAPGVVRLEIATTGGDLDLDGYTVLVDGVFTRTADPNETLVLSGLAPGVHTVALVGASENCSVSPAAHEITVTRGHDITVSFAITCVVTGIAITVATAGVDLDPSLMVAVDGLATSLAPGGSTTVTRLSPGTHLIGLSDLAPNCAVDGLAQREIAVAMGTVVPFIFSVACVAVTGKVTVTVVTSGLDRDRDGYSLQVDGATTQRLAINETRAFEQLSEGAYRVRLGEVASNCSLEGESERTAPVRVGGLVRDTARVAFSLTCTPRWRLTFAQQGRSDPVITLVSADGAETEELGIGLAPVWSPDGAWLAHGCGDDICISSTAGIVRRISPPPTSYYDFYESPAWHPDGRRIAVVTGHCSGNDIYDSVCTYDFSLIDWAGGGSQVIPAPRGVFPGGRPAWSPNGRQLAFTCVLPSVSSASYICIIGTDGTFRRLTNSFLASNPHWSPDGRRIAFATTRFGLEEIAQMNPDGSAVTRLNPGTWASEPSWFPDGSRILFTRWPCASPACSPRIPPGVFRMNADGTGIVRLTTGTHSSPAWRP